MKTAQHPRLFNCLSHRDSAPFQCLSHRDSAPFKCLPQVLGTLPVPPTGTRHPSSASPTGTRHPSSASPTGPRHSPSVTQCYSARMQRDSRSSNLRHTRSDIYINVRPEPCGTYFTIFQIFMTAKPSPASLIND
ncbi:hypothetical protein Adt_36913 [Abeliophyllum distichum]|uniref:Uncharacterized protein n=1 Tax=Abeliophyllum distichum TaxID=126358 RepID=A0ABD1QIX8_9LAMI